MKEVDIAREALKAEFEKLDDKKAIMRSASLRALFDGIREFEQEKRAEYGQAVNQLKSELQEWIDEQSARVEVVTAIDVTAPWDINTPSGKRPRFLRSAQGSLHPLKTEIERICDIYMRMGFVVEESREIDDDYHMFESLNFPSQKYLDEF
jgi:phenylalanyl-tRNA synthetase alpha chain